MDSLTKNLRRTIIIERSETANDDEKSEKQDEDDDKDDAEEPEDDDHDERDSEEDDKSSLPTTTITSSESDESIEVMQIWGNSDVEIEEAKKRVPPPTDEDSDTAGIESLELVEYIAGWEKGNNSNSLKEEQANQNEILESEESEEGGKIQSVLEIGPTSIFFPYCLRLNFDNPTLSRGFQHLLGQKEGVRN